MKLLWSQRALRLALVTQAVWLVMSAARQGSLRGLLYATGVTLGFAALAVAGERLAWLAPLLRMFIGVAFVSAVADRLGLFGGPGTPGVSWGSFDKFEAYTGQVNAFLPAAVIPLLAVVETFVEGGLGLVMLLGFFTQKASAGSACLLATFAAAMTVSLGFASQFPFAVLVLAGGAWLLAELDSTARWSVDGLLKRRAQGAGGAAAATQ